ncbi:MAG: PKD-like domain-containing protein [Bacteroidia bacterium]
MKKILLSLVLLSVCFIMQAQVANDDCVNATPIAIPASGNICITGTTANALGTIYTSHPCYPINQNIPDVWYTFIAAGSQNVVTVTPTGGTPASQVGVTLTNFPCSSGSLSTCNMSSTAGGTASANYIYAAGTQVWINVGSVLAQGGFQLCITSTTPVPGPGGSCATATVLCDKSTFTLPTFPGNVTPLQPSCFGNSFQDPVFYQFTCGQSGTCEWTANPIGNATELDWVMYDITSTCPNNTTPELACNFFYAGSSGANAGMSSTLTTANCPITNGIGPNTYEYCAPANLVAGNTYMIIIDNYTAIAGQNAGFTMSFGGTFTIAPTSQFTANPLNSCSPPVNVTFTNTSTTAVSYSWNFANGNTSTATTPPAQTYTASGVYLVSLAATSHTGCVDISTQTITVGTPPTVTVPTNTTVCTGGAIPAAVFTSTPSGATFAWTNSNPAIGLAASGNANIPAFNATNSTGATITGVVTVTPTLNGCVGAPQSYTITVNPGPTLTAVTSQTVCANAAAAAVNYSSNPAGATVNWTNTNATIGVAASGVGDILSFTALNAGNTAVAGNFSATPTLAGCTGPPVTFTITVNPIPVLTAVPSQTICATTNTTAINFVTNPASTVNWTNSDNTIGVGASGVGNIAAFTGTNSGAAGVTANFSATPVVNGCTGAPQTFSITVNPMPVLSPVPGETLCAGNPTTAITYTVNPAASAVNWTNSNGSIGVGTSGLGNIPSFTGTNITAASASGNFVATPSLNGCTGATQTFTITVNPSPVLTAIPSQTVCATISTTAINFVSNPAGATVNWTNSDNTIGVGASGTGNIGAFTGTNAGAVPATGNFSATPVMLGCTGPAQTFSITVNPMPVLSPVPSQTLCAGNPTTAIAYTVNPAASAVNWTNSNGSIGVGTSGLGNIPSFTAANITAASAIGNFTATPSLNGCTGATQSFTITVNPTPVLTAIPSQTVCAGANTSAVNYVSNPAGATINWTNSDNTIGVGASGVGNIASFAGNNPGIASVTGNFSAVPVMLGCTGPAQTFSITVNPIPSIPAVTSQTVCAGLPTATINFNPSPAATAVNWTNSQPSIGTAGSGSGDISAFNGINSTTAAVTGNFIATPTLNGCSGPAQNFSITINPGVVVNPIANVTVCNTAAVPASAFTSTPAGASFGWTNNDPSIGLAAFGLNNYATFNASNLGTSPVTALISVTPTLNGCTGPAVTYTITVNPTPAPPNVANVTYCLLDIAVPLTATPSAGATINWWGTSAAGGASSSVAPTPSTSATGTINYYVSEVIATCESPRAQIQVIVNPLPTITTPANITVCAGAAVPGQSFTSNPVGANLNWSNNNSSIGLAASGTGNVPGFNGTNSGSTILTGVITVVPDLNGCVGPAITYSVNIDPIPTVSVSNVTVCNNANVAATSWVSVPAGSTYTWVNSDPTIGLSASGNGNATAFTALNPGSAAVVAIVSVTPTLNGCVGIAYNYNITVNPTPAAPQTTNVTYCVNDAAVALIGIPSAGGSLNWYGTNASGGPSSATAPTPSTAVAGTTNYYVSQTISNCEGPRAPLAVLVNPLPVATLSPPAAGCETFCTDLTVTSVPPGISYNWDLGNGLFSGNDSVHNCYPLSGIYNVSVTVTDVNNCTALTAFPTWITVYSKPVPDFTASPQPVSILEPNVDFINLSTGTALSNYIWEFGDPLNSTSTLVNPSFDYSVAGVGTYSVTLIAYNINGCVDSITKPIIIEDDFTLYIPNAFSPNDDGINDFFYPKGIGIDEKHYQLWIFDRWGNMIFYSDEWDKWWDGKVQGKGDDPVQEDVYVWKMKVRSFKGDKKSLVGHVTVVR